MSAPKGDSEPGVILLLLAAVLFGVGWFFWHQFKEPILEGMRWLRYVELFIVNIFSGKQDACLHWLRHARFGDTSPSSDMVNWAQECFSNPYLKSLSEEAAFDHYRLSGRAMTDIEKIISAYDYWVLAALFAGIGLHILYVSPRMKFRTRHTLESFITTQAKMWPVISPIVKFNPTKASARKPGDMVPDKIPPFAEAFSPEEWVSWFRIPVVNNLPDREATRRAFLLQLGPRWNGIQGAPSYVQALFAAFALKGAQRREESDKLLSELSLAWSAQGMQIPGKLMDDIRRIVRDKDVGERALEIADQHAFRTPAMLGVLKWARFQGGVLAPAQFIWLRAVDRALWYPLNNLGRRSFHTEGAGAMAHFMAEQIAKKPLPVPRIDTAIITLNQYLVRPDALPIPPREGDRPIKRRN